MKNLQELLSKPVWQMTGEEFIFLSKHASRQTETQPQPVTDTERKYVYGILGIAKLFGCSLPTDRKSTRLNSSHIEESRMPSSA